MPTADCIPITAAPGLSRLFLDYCAGSDSVAAVLWRRVTATHPTRRSGSAVPRYRDIGWSSSSSSPSKIVPATAGRPSVPSAAARAWWSQDSKWDCSAARSHAFQSSDGIARARQATAAGHPHVAIFWLASEDHDFAEINHVTFPARRELRNLVYERGPRSCASGGRAWCSTSPSSR